MKRKIQLLSLVAVFLSAASPMFAQDYLSLPAFKSGKTVWIVRAGMGFNGVAGSNKDTQQALWDNSKWDGSFKPAIGYEVSIGFNKSFGEHPMYWGMELGLGTRGYKTSASWEVGGTNSVGHGSDYHGRFQDITLNCHTVKLSPFTIGYKYTFLKNMAADLHLGAYASYDFAGKQNNEYVDRVISTSQYGNVNKEDKSSSDVKIGDMDNMRKYDAGFNLGIGYWFGRFNIDFTWQRGFFAIFDDGDTMVKIGKSEQEKGNLYTNNFQLRLGYAF